MNIRNARCPHGVKVKRCSACRPKTNLERMVEEVQARRVDGRLEPIPFEVRLAVTPKERAMLEEREAKKRRLELGAAPEKEAP